MSVPTYTFNMDEAEAAFSAYVAICNAAKSEPTLMENEFFLAARESAFARFITRFNALEVG
tara:strand:- start:4044 stop:4226 length:183 start_codon:yes stop_codon:yes gene_type:complete